jgi:arginyl-tRNA--protein-N-Asp/Glu arginylyltransferase
MLTDAIKSNFNLLLSYSEKGAVLGCTVCFISDSLLHYSYPFYNLETSAKDMGMGMMIRAIVYAKEKRLKYIYLGSLQRAGDTYKLQFEGMEWFDGTAWSTDLAAAKKILKKEE